MFSETATSSKVVSKECKISAFFLVNGLLLSIFLISIAPIFFFGFKQAVSAVYVQYLICCHFFYPVQNDDGYSWDEFSLHFPVFKTLRRYTNFKIIVSKTLETEEEEITAKFIFAAFPHGGE